MIDEYETEVILAPTRPQMVDLMEDGLDLLSEHCGCTYTVKTKSQGNYEAVIDAGGGMYFRVRMVPSESDINQETIYFEWGYMESGVFVSRYSTSRTGSSVPETSEHYASVISVNNGAAWIFTYKYHYQSGISYEDGYICMRSVLIKSGETADEYRSGRVYFSTANERQMWPDYANAYMGDYVNPPNGACQVRAIDNFDNARYCVPADKAMLYPSMISFDNKRHLGVPTIGDEPVYWLVRNTRVPSWREFYVGGVRYVTLGHVAFRSLEREQEEEA